MKSIDSYSIASNIKRIRTERNLTQMEFALLLGYSDRQVRRLEANGTENISVINQIAREFNLNVEALLF